MLLGYCSQTFYVTKIVSWLSFHRRGHHGASWRSSLERPTCAACKVGAHRGSAGQAQPSFTIATGLLLLGVWGLAHGIDVTKVLRLVQQVGFICTHSKGILISLHNYHQVTICRRTTYHARMAHVRAASRARSTARFTRRDSISRRLMRYPLLRVLSVPRGTGTATLSTEHGLGRRATTGSHLLTSCKQHCSEGPSFSSATAWLVRR